MDYKVRDYVKKSIYANLEDIANAQSGARNFVGIGWADTFARGTHFAIAFLSFVGSIQKTMGWHDKMCLA